MHKINLALEFGDQGSEFLFYLVPKLTDFSQKLFKFLLHHRVHSNVHQNIHNV